MQGWALGNDRRPVVETRKKTLLARGFHKQCRWLISLKLTNSTRVGERRKNML
jgi:hypothetical protein